MTNLHPTDGVFLALRLQMPTLVVDSEENVVDEAWRTIEELMRASLPEWAVDGLVDYDNICSLTIECGSGEIHLRPFSPLHPEISEVEGFNISIPPAVSFSGYGMKNWWRKYQFRVLDGSTMEVAMTLHRFPTKTVRTK